MTNLTYPQVTPWKYFVGDEADIHALHTWVFIEARAQRDGSLLWVVTRNGDVLSKSTQQFCYEMQPSSRTDEWIADTRFPSPEAALHAYYTLLNTGVVENAEHHNSTTGQNNAGGDT